MSCAAHARQFSRKRPISAAGCAERGHCAHPRGSASRTGVARRRARAAARVFAISTSTPHCCVLSQPRFHPRFARCCRSPFAARLLRDAARALQFARRLTIRLLIEKRATSATLQSSPLPPIVAARIALRIAAMLALPMRQTLACTPTHAAAPRRAGSALAGRHCRAQRPVHQRACASAAASGSRPAAAACSDDARRAPAPLGALLAAAVLVRGTMRPRTSQRVSPARSVLRLSSPALPTLRARKTAPWSRWR